MSQQLQAIIEQAFEQRAEFSPQNAPNEVREAVNQTINLLDQGELRVAEKISGEWTVNQWVKKAVLLSFKLNENSVMRDGMAQYYDKVPLKFADFSEQEFAASGVRVVPPAVARKGSFVAPNVVMMPSY